MSGPSASGGQAATVGIYEFALAAGCSDGKLWTEESYKGTIRLNPDGSADDKQKYQEYGLKLGGLLRDQFLSHDRSARGRIYILKELPLHYHIRKKQRTKGAKKEKDSFDYFIYGHPTSDRSGNPRSFNSPNDFFSHLIFLTGNERDNKYCSCKLCNKSAKPEPESLKRAISVPDPNPPASTLTAASSAKAPTHLQSTSMRRTPSASSTPKPSAALPATSTHQAAPQSVPPAAAPAVSQPAAQPAPRVASQTAPPQVVHQAAHQATPQNAPQAVHQAAHQAAPQNAPQVAHQAAHQAPPQAAPQAAAHQAVHQASSQAAPQFAHQVAPQVTPQAAAPAQQAAPPSQTRVTRSTAAQVAQVPQPVDATIFRGGEVVWYKNNNAWRLGVVIGVVPAGPTTGSPIQCQIKPLAHAALPLDAVLKVESDMRPFLAFSVPPVNMKEIQGLRMSDINWEQIQAQYVRDERHKELVGLEASKKAVMEIDKTFSTFNPFPDAPENGGREFVGGVFLGAERISVGEAVRVRLNPNETNPAWIKGLPIVMVPRSIFVVPDGLHFFGEVFRLEETPIQQPEVQLPLPLPEALVRERAFRNRIKGTASGIRYDWVLVQQNQDKVERAVRGRFYETEKIMPILQLPQFNDELNRGIVPDTQACLNNRLDSMDDYIGRRRNRLEALSTSVPGGFSLNFGPGIVEH